MTTATLLSADHRNKLKALRAAADDPTDPIFEAAVAVLQRFEELKERGYDEEIALDKAYRECNQTVGDTGGA
jgi:hypothetical protein